MTWLPSADRYIQANASNTEDNPDRGDLATTLGLPDLPAPENDDLPALLDELNDLARSLNIDLSFTAGPGWGTGFPLFVRVKTEDEDRPLELFADTEDGVVYVSDGQSDMFRCEVPASWLDLNPDLAAGIRDAAAMEVAVWVMRRATPRLH